MNDSDQIRHFCEKIAEFDNRPPVVASTWSQAFAQLDGILHGEGQTVVLLDEISWMGGYNADFPGYLKESWDKKLRKHPNLILVLCGSVSAWIVENILNSTGFVGRNSLDIELKELELSECVSLWGPSASRLSSCEIFDLLSVTGCVPKYVDEIRPELSIEENVRRLCFRPQGMLFREFNETFNSIFGSRIASRGKILRMLASGPQSAAELAAIEGKDGNGSYTKALHDLLYAGFVGKENGLNPETGKPLREERYRIKDNYTRFYLHFIEPRHTSIENGLFEFSSLEQLSGWETALGLAFENLVLNHVNTLFPLLGLSRTLVLSAAPYRQSPTERKRGCQIDLLIQTQRSLMVVEIKRQKEIGHDIIDQVDAKVRTLSRRRELSVRTALVYDGRLSPSVPADGYFDFIIPAAKLLGD